MWKIGIKSLIRITQSKIRLIENMAFLVVLVILEIFEMALLRLGKQPVLSSNYIIMTICSIASVESISTCSGAPVIVTIC